MGSEGGGHAAPAGAEHKGHDPEHTAKEMSALFPQPQADLSQQERPTKPELVTPAFYEAVSAGKTTLQWKASTGAEAYHVQVATDANFKWLVSESFDVKGTSYEVSGLEAGKNYYWRVLGSKMSNVSQFTKSGFSSSMFRVK
jgi:hypothetical protein